MSKLFKTGFIFIGAIFVDQLTKYLAIGLTDPISIFNTALFKLELHLSYNDAFAFSIKSPKLVIITTVLLILTIVIYSFYKAYINNQTKYLYIIIVLAGALSNLFDRLFREGVVDFIAWKLNGFQWGSFNIADALILSGALLWAMNEYSSDQKELSIR